MTSFSLGIVAVHQHGEPDNAVDWGFCHAREINSISTIPDVNPSIKAPTTAHQASSMRY
jgi:hypothetical protein